MGSVRLLHCEVIRRLIWMQWGTKSLAVSSNFKSMMSKNKSYNNQQIRQSNIRYWSWVIVLIIVAVTAAIRVRLLDIPLERDEGEYAYAGQLILQGVLPYARVYNMKMPGIYAAYALILAVFGQTQSSIHLGLLVVNVATILLMFLLAKRLFGPFVAVATAAVYSIISMGRPVLGLFAHAEHFVVLAAVAGILILLRAIDSNRRPMLFLSGLLFGLAFLIRQHGSAFALFAAFYLLLELRRRRVHWAKILSRFALLCAGVVVPFVLTCIALLIAGVFDKFWFWTFVYAQEYVSSFPLLEGLNELKTGMSRIVGSAILVWILAGIGLTGLLWNRKARQRSLFLLGFLLFSFLAVCPGFYFRSHYFVLLLPAVALLAGIGAATVRDFFARDHSAIVAKVTPILLLLLVLFHAAYHQRNFLFFMSPTMVSRATYGFNPFPESLEIAKYIKENSSEDDSIAILGSEPQIYFYSNRRSATGYIYIYPLVELHPYALQMQQEMISELESARPKFLVFVTIYESWLSELGAPKLILEWFRQYRPKYYEQVGVIDIASLDKTIYRWGEDAIGYWSRSENYILVFRRKD